MSFQFIKQMPTPEKVKTDYPISPELAKIKEIQVDVIMGACKLSKSQLDPRGNRSEGWGGRASIYFVYQGLNF